MVVPWAYGTTGRVPVHLAPTEGVINTPEAPVASPRAAHRGVLNVLDVNAAGRDARHSQEALVRGAGRQVGTGERGDARERVLKQVTARWSGVDCALVVGGAVAATSGQHANANANDGRRRNSRQNICFCDECVSTNV